MNRNTLVNMYTFMTVFSSFLKANGGGHAIEFGLKSKEVSDEEFEAGMDRLVDMGIMKREPIEDNEQVFNEIKSKNPDSSLEDMVCLSVGPFGVHSFSMLTKVIEGDGSNSLIKQMVMGFVGEYDLSNEEIIVLTTLHHIVMQGGKKVDFTFAFQLDKVADIIMGVASEDSLDFDKLALAIGSLITNGLLVKGESGMERAVMVSPTGSCQVVKLEFELANKLDEDDTSAPPILH